jgi:hypothetical protein
MGGIYLATRTRTGRPPSLGALALTFGNAVRPSRDPEPPMGVNIRKKR